jgi:hypothetical protein
MIGFEKPETHETLENSHISEGDMIDWRYLKAPRKIELILTPEREKLSFSHQLPKELEYSSGFYL